VWKGLSTSGQCSATLPCRGNSSSSSSSYIDHGKKEVWKGLSTSGQCSATLPCRGNSSSSSSSRSSSYIDHGNKESAERAVHQRSVQRHVALQGQQQQQQQQQQQ
jgi:hypothetical protein